MYINQNCSDLRNGTNQPPFRGLNAKKLPFFEKLNFKNTVTHDTMALFSFSLDDLFHPRKETRVPRDVARLSDFVKGEELADDSGSRERHKTERERDFTTASLAPAKPPELRDISPPFSLRILLLELFRREHRC